MKAEEFHKTSNEKGILFFDDDYHIMDCEIYKFAEAFLDHEVNAISDEEAKETIYRAIEFEIGHDRSYNVSQTVQKSMANAIWVDLNKLLNKEQ